MLAGQTIIFEASGCQSRGCQSSLLVIVCTDVRRYFPRNGSNAKFFLGIPLLWWLEVKAALICSLGFPESVISQPCDVVDNDYFAVALKANFKYCNPHFLCVSRFVEKKNHFGLLDALQLISVRVVLWAWS